jgi:hypothetical protein
MKVRFVDRRPESVGECCAHLLSVAAERRSAKVTSPLPRTTLAARRISVERLICVLVTWLSMFAWRKILPQLLS